MRARICKYAERRSNKLVVGPGGNISAKFEGKMYLSPSGFALDEIEPEQWVEVDIETGEITDIGLASIFRGVDASCMLIGPIRISARSCIRIRLIALLLH